MKIALIHEHLAQDGGAERVLQAFQELYPDAPTYTLVYDRKRSNPSFRNRQIHTSFIQKIPLGLRHYQWFLPWMPTAVEHYNLTEYDVILSSCSAFAKGVITRPDCLHICYCHSPTRYLWSDTHSYIQELRYPQLIKKIIPFILPRIRIWDQLAAQRVDHFIANSEAVRKRIAKYYRRPSTVIYPPVDLRNYKISDGYDNFFLIGGRLVAYKRYDLAIQAFNKLGLNLKIFGSGPEEKQLRKIAKPNIEFLGSITEAEKAELMSRASAFVFPQEEDFGITAIEAMAAGRPVIAFAKGGALDTVIEGKTGAFFTDQNWAALADTVLRFKPGNYAPSDIRAHAEKFDQHRFKEQIGKIVSEHWQQKKHI